MMQVPGNPAPPLIVTVEPEMLQEPGVLDESMLNVTDKRDEASAVTGY